MIPRVIHYCWFGGRSLPPAAEACIDSWRKVCPGYELRRWSEEQFDVSQCAFARQAFERSEWAFLSDYARLKIVHDHGGIYLDTDVELVRPLDDLLVFQAFFGFQHDQTVNTGHGFGAVPRQAVVAALLSSYEAQDFIKADGQPDRTPCPQRDSAVFERLGFRLDGTRQERDGVAIVPPPFFSPKSFHSGRVAMTAETYAIHHFDASWHSPIEAALLGRMRRYCNAFGEPTGRWLYHLDCRARNLAVKCGLGQRRNDAADDR
jgi:hypothetical protein